MSELIISPNTHATLLPDQKIVADTISVPLKRDEILMLIDSINKNPETDKDLSLIGTDPKKLHDLSQKLNNKLKTLETCNEIR